MSIRVLDADTVQKIAAGEVVERPASVAKELLENAIDAGSTQISLVLRGGGVSYLEVLDNGCGLAPDEAMLAFERHATSKIIRATDLEQITTLGFRGEALASIAAVSRVTLTTREAGNVAGTRVKVAGGEKLGRETVGCPPGTKVQVEDLFYNVPARRHFLQSERAETRSVVEVVVQQALAWPGISLRATRDGQLVCQTPGQGELGEAVAAVLGPEVARQMAEVRETGDSLEVGGYVGRQALHRASRKQQYFYVNGRYIYHARLAAVVEQAYATMLPSGRHPVCVIYLRLDPAAVDVNIHPNKLRVRFREEEAVVGLLRRAVARALQPRYPVPEVKFDHHPAPPRGLVWPAAGEESSGLSAQLHETQLHETTGQARECTASTLELLYAPAAAGAAELSGLAPLSQLNSLYILAAGEDGSLYIIDQHAAHERVRYEKLRAAADQEPPVQFLAVARPVNLPVYRVGAPAELLDVLSRLGFRVEEVGPHTWWLRAIPADLTLENGVQLFEDLVEMWGSGEEVPDRLDAGRKLVACRGAVQAGQQLNRDEMQSLLEQLAATPRPYTCPHGRPAVLKLAASWLNRQFGR